MSDMSPELGGRQEPEAKPRVVVSWDKDGGVVYKDKNTGRVVAINNKGEWQYFPEEHKEEGGVAIEMGAGEPERGMVPVGEKKDVGSVEMSDKEVEYARTRISANPTNNVLPDLPTWDEGGRELYERKAAEDRDNVIHVEGEVIDDDPDIKQTVGKAGDDEEDEPVDAEVKQQAVSGWRVGYDRASKLPEGGLRNEMLRTWLLNNMSELSIPEDLIAKVAQEIEDYDAGRNTSPEPVAAPEPPPVVPEPVVAGSEGARENNPLTRVIEDLEANQSEGLYRMLLSNPNEDPGRRNEQRIIATILLADAERDEGDDFDRNAAVADINNAARDAAGRERLWLAARGIYFGEKLGEEIMQMRSNLQMMAGLEGVSQQELQNLRSDMLRRMGRELSGSTPDTIRSEIIRWALNATEKPKPPRIEVPKEERALRLFIRDRAREAVRTIGDPSQLSIKYILEQIQAKMGLDREAWTPINLFPPEVSGIKEIQKSIEGEILARCTLRAAELQEQGYKRMKDKGEAIKRYLSDMKGSGGEPKAVVIDRGTLMWLKNLNDEGDGLSRARVDQAFQVLTMLGENQPKGTFTGDLDRFNAYLQETGGNGDTGVRNFYSPEYRGDLYDAAFEDLREVCGDDAASLAWQMFQAFKEEGNYNWDHYMARLFTFSNTRHALATILKVYTGSRRIYLPEANPTYADEYVLDATAPGGRRRITYKDGQVQKAALSPLRVAVKTGPGENDKSYGEFLQRALRGGFLRETPFESHAYLKYEPQIDSYNTIDNGMEFRDVISEIGKLGATEEKSGKDRAAIGFLKDLRAKGQRLVATGVCTQAEMDRTIELSVRDVFWELSIDNPTNVMNLSSQSKQKPYFLLPSTLNVLFEAVGGRTTNGDWVLGGREESTPEETRESMRKAGERYSRLRTYVEDLKRRTYEKYMTLPGEDEVQEEAQKSAVELVNLPEELGGGMRSFPSKFDKSVAGKLPKGDWYGKTPWGKMFDKTFGRLIK